MGKQQGWPFPLKYLAWRWSKAPFACFKALGGEKNTAVKQVTSAVPQTPSTLWYTASPRRSVASQDHATSNVTDFLSLSPLRCLWRTSHFNISLRTQLTVPADGDRPQLPQQTASWAFRHQARAAPYPPAPCWQGRVEAVVSSRSRAARVDPETSVGAWWQASGHGGRGGGHPFPLAPTLLCQGVVRRGEGLPRGTPSPLPAPAVPRTARTPGAGTRGPVPWAIPRAGPAASSPGRQDGAFGCSGPRAPGPGRDVPPGRASPRRGWLRAGGGGPCRPRRGGHPEPRQPAPQPGGVSATVSAGEREAEPAAARPPARSPRPGPRMQPSPWSGGGGSRSSRGPPGSGCSSRGTGCSPSSPPSCSTPWRR